MQLHDWLARFFLNGQSVKGLSHFIGHILHHVNFIARPGTPVIALL
jgi:hypothetical protein